MELFFVLFILVGVLVLALIFGNIADNRIALDEYFSKLKNFTVTQKLDGLGLPATGIAVDEKLKKICLFSSSNKKVNAKIYPYKDILSSEIIKDGVSITKTSRSSQLGHALIGGLAFGGVGAIIGGLTGKTKTTEAAKSFDLCITVNDTEKPVHCITIIHIEQAKHFHGLLQVFIKQADSEDNNKKSKEIKHAEQTSQPPASIADELKKLAELRDSGILTDDEFENQKTKLL